MEKAKQEKTTMSHDELKGECKKLGEILVKKNTDYGNSFEVLLNEYGDTAFLIRISDKFNRLKQLNKNESLVDESFNDTVLDLAGYCMLYLTIKKSENGDI